MHQQNGENPMKNHALAFICVTFLLVVLVAPVHASVSVESTVEDNVYVIYKFENLNSTIYNEVIANEQFNSSTIPQIIVKNLERQNLARVNYDFQPNMYDDATRTVRVSFYLGGSDIISFTVNRTTLRRTYQVKTEWRKFQVNLTSSFPPIDFAQSFSEPVANWQKTNYTTGGSTHPTFYYETKSAGFLGTLSFYFILPTAASNIKVEGETITYEVPPYFEDVFLGSPFLILVALIIIIAIVLVYRIIK